MLLWLIYLYCAPGFLGTARDRDGVLRGNFRDPIYADDLTTVSAARSWAQSSSWVGLNLKHVQGTVGGLFLTMSVPRTRNVSLDLLYCPAGVCRRDLPITCMSTRPRVKREYQREAPSGTTDLDFHPLEAETGELRAKPPDACPAPLSESTRVLGAANDWSLVLDAHLQTVPTRARVRQGILRRVARTMWGLETAALRITHNAVITSLLRYGVVLVGSCAPGDLCNKMERSSSDAKL